MVEVYFLICVDYKKNGYNEILQSESTYFMISLESVILFFVRHRSIKALTVNALNTIKAIFRSRRVRVWVASVSAENAICIVLRF